MKIGKLKIDVVQPQSPYIRAFTKFCMEHFDGDELVGCEVGVWEGINTKVMLQSLNIRKLYLIDAYKQCPLVFYLYEDGKLTNDDSFTQKKYDLAKKKAVRNLKGFCSKTAFIYKSSEGAVGGIPGGSLDFCYIDANHMYDHIKRDIELWYTKVRVGGVIGGHDFVLYNGVVFAVVDCIRKFGVKEYCASVDDWWFVKNKLLKQV